MEDKVPSVTASLQSPEEKVSNVKIVRAPDAWPSWTASFDDRIATFHSATRVCTQWLSGNTIQRSLTTPLSKGPPTATALARLHRRSDEAQLPADYSEIAESSRTQGRPRRKRSASLCVACRSTIYVSAPNGDLHECPIASKTLPSQRITGLFPLEFGMIIELTAHNSTNKSPNHSPRRKYFYMLDPLEEICELLHLDEDESLVYASSDIPVIITRSGTHVKLWGVVERQAPSHGHSLECAISPTKSSSSSRSKAQIEEVSSMKASDICPFRSTLDLIILHRARLRPGSVVSSFVSHDIKGCLVLNILVASTLISLDLTFDSTRTVIISASPVSQLNDVVSAVPILGCRRGSRALDILVQQSPSRSLSLYIGSYQICTVELEDLPHSKIARARELPGMRGLTLAEDSGSCFILSSAGKGSRKYSLNGISFKSRLTNDCVDALCCAFVKSESAQISQIYRTAIFQLHSFSNSFLNGKAYDQEEWEMLLRVILRSSMTSSSRPARGKAFKNSVDALDGDAAGKGKDGVTDWEFLMKMQQVAQTPLQPNCLGINPRHPQNSIVGNTHVTNSSFCKKNLTRALEALHLLYEDRKLNTLRSLDLEKLASGILTIAVKVGNIAFLDYYRREFPMYCNIFLAKGDGLDAGSPGAEVPSICNYLVKIMEGENACGFPRLDGFYDGATQPGPLMASWAAKNPASRTRSITQYYRCLYGNRDDNDYHSLKRAEKLLRLMLHDGFEKADLESLPFGVALPLQDALWICSKNPKCDWPYEAFFLIGREDLLPSNVGCQDPDEYGNISGDKSSAVLRLRRIQAIPSSAVESAAMANGGNALLYDSSTREVLQSQNFRRSESQNDGCDMDDLVFTLRFGEDRRLEEVRRMLISTKPVVISPITAPPHGQEDGETDITSKLQAKLAILLRKRLAAPVGRGAFTLRTYIPTDPTKSLEIPSICLNGHLFGQKFARLRLTNATPLSITWGEFHNGVASGLRLAAAETDRDSDSRQILTRSWIVSHKPTDDSEAPDHAGMLLALGLGGYLPALRATDYYQYLLPRHELTSIGLMLGLACGNRGSKHDKITKMLYVHVRYFNSAGFSVPDFNIPVSVQSAAIIGLGLVHMESYKVAIVEGLLAELTRCSTYGNEVDGREGLSLSAGISIGMVCLGAGISDSESWLMDQLVLCANGGLKASQQPESRLESLESLKSSQENNASERERLGLADSDACRIVESEYVNVDVVAPGALLALALIYLKTNNRLAANRIVVPNTYYSLNRARPDHVFLQILCRSLILWDEISPHAQWIVSCLPPLLRSRKMNLETVDFALEDTSGCSVYDLHSEIDTHGILAARCFAVAGGCTAVALRCAGSCNRNAIHLLSRACENFENALLHVTDDCEDREWVYATCLSSCSIALGIVAAGSGDLEILRLLRRLRKRSGPSLQRRRYGRHMAMDMAIGFLFLGGGCQTFGTTNSAIAALLCTIYPRFPTDVMDNQYHLQALRHFYVLAVEPRCIETRDVDTDTPCYVDIEIHMKNKSSIRVSAPCIVPPASEVDRISIVSERYLPKTIELNASEEGKGWYSSTSRQILYVKRRPGHLPHRVDPKGSKGILARSLTRRKTEGSSRRSDRAHMEHIARSFSTDPGILAFARYSCSLGYSNVDDIINSGSLGIMGYNPAEVADENSRRYSKILLDCLATDKANALPLYFGAERSVAAVQKGMASPGAIGSLLIAEQYLNSGPIFDSTLIGEEDLSFILLPMRTFLGSADARLALRDYLRSRGSRWPEGRLSIILGYLLRYHRIPQLAQLRTLMEVLERKSKTKLTREDIWLLCMENLSPSIGFDALEYLPEALATQND